MVIGGIVDLTNPEDPNLNLKLYQERKNVLMSLTVENEYCQQVGEPYYFVARSGTVHFVSKKIDPNQYFNYGNTCDKKVLFVKIKKAFDQSKIQSSQRNYMVNVTGQVKDPNEDPNSNETSIDSFAYVTNTGASINYVKHDGTKLELTQCDKTPCKLNYEAGKNRLNTLIRNFESFSENPKSFQVGNYVDVYPKNYNFIDSVKPDLYSSISDYKSFTILANGIQSRPILDKDKVDALIRQEEAFLPTIKTDRSNLRVQVGELETLLNSPRINGEVVLEKVKDVSKNSLDLTKKITNSSFDLDNGKVTGVSSPKYAGYVINTLTLIKDLLEVATVLNELNGDAKYNYDIVISEVNQILNKSIQDECLLNADKSLLSRIRNFAIVYVANPLNEKIQSIDNKGIWQLTEKELVDASNLAISLKPNLDVVAQKLIDECKEDPNECNSSDFKYQLSDYFISQINLLKSEKTIKCRVNYTSFKVKRNDPELSTIKNNLNRTNEIRRTASSYEKESVMPVRTAGFAYVRDKDINQIKYFCGVSGQTRINNTNAYCDEFADPIPAVKRIYDISEMQNSEPYHTEVRIIEHIANKYCSRNSDGTIKQCRNLEIKFFTDRQTCGSCNSFLKEKVKAKTSSFEVDFYKTNEYKDLQGIFFEGVGELIPIKSPNFYNGN